MNESHGTRPRPASRPSPSPAPAADLERGGAVEPTGTARRAGPAAAHRPRQQLMAQESTQEALIVRYELRDPTQELTHRAKTYREIWEQAEHLGARRFTAVHADGTRSPFRKVGGEWQRGDRLPPLLQAPPDLLTTRDDMADHSSGLEAALASMPPAGRAKAVPARANKANAKALAKIDAEATRAAMVARIESSLSERYIIKRVPITLGDMTIGSTEYRFRGDSSRVAFTESNLRLSTDTNNPSVARSMVDLAQARGWKGLRVSGAEDFRRLVWLEATVRGVKALGYEPTPAELGMLKRERDKRQSNRIEPTPEAKAGVPVTASEKSSSRGGGRKAVLAAIEAILVEKKVPEAKRQAVLAAAEERLAQMARSGHAPKIKVYDRNAERQMSTPAISQEQSRPQERTAPTHLR